MAITLAIKIDQAKHGGESCLLETNGYTTKSGALRGLAGDKIPLEIYWRTVASDGQSSTAYNVPASMLSFGSDLIPAAQLTGATDAGTGDTQHVAAILDLSALTSELIAALASKDEQEVMLDFSVAEAAGKRLTYRVPMLVSKQAATGSASVAVGISISQPGGVGSPIVITANGRSVQL